jgi:hypothetical protein
MWSCPDCGAQNPTEAAFCTQCGRPAQKPGKKSKTALLIGGGILALALVGLGLWLLLGKKAEQSASEDAVDPIPHYRLVSYDYQMVVNDSFGETVYDPYHYTYVYDEDGRGGVIQCTLSYLEVRFTCERSGALLTKVGYLGDGSVSYRLEYENDQWGNHTLTRQYDRDGALSSLEEAAYNPYKVVESKTYTAYLDDGSVDYVQRLSFPTPEEGTYTVTYADGSTVSAVIRRTYNEQHQLLEEFWAYEDGWTKTETYVRDEAFNILSLTEITTRPSSTDPYVTKTYTYQWERVSLAPLQ